jgi:hypothetical protein
LILEQLLNGVLSVSLEEANVHISVDSYEEWMDFEKVLANRDTTIALVRLVEFKKYVRPLTLNVVLEEENFNEGGTL